jgi:hypothetical protein
VTLKLIREFASSVLSSKDEERNESIYQNYRCEAREKNILLFENMELRTRINCDVKLGIVYW